MRFGTRRVIAGVAAAAAVWMVSVALVRGQAAQDPNQMMSEQVFQNVQVLRGITVDEFMGTMGVFSAALGISCEDCHTASSNDWANYAQDASPRKQTARQMTLMMNAINRANFGGRQVVTCMTCHRGSVSPRATASLNLLYGAPPPYELDVRIEAEPDAPAANDLIDRYLQAVGGAAQLNALTSYTGKGTYSGYGPEAFGRPFELYARAPGQRTIVVRDPDSGDITTTITAETVYHSAPFRPVDVLELHGPEREGAQMEAQAAFPQNIRQWATEWRVGYRDILDDRVVRPIQGERGDLIFTLYFDEETGLLNRFERSSPSVVGRLPVRVDIRSYGDVPGAGVKVPFQWTVTWLDGRANYELSEVQGNAAIDAARFARPAPPKPY